MRPSSSKNVPYCTDCRFLLKIDMGLDMYIVYKIG